VDGNGLFSKCARAPNIFIKPDFAKKPPSRLCKALEIIIKSNTMTGEQLQPMVRFEAKQWSKVYDADRRDGITFIFRRGAEVVLDTCLSISRPGEHWLDMGCGTGDLAAKISEAGRIVTGVDCDPAMLEHAQGRFRDKSQSDRLKFIVADSENLPFRSKRFDGVTATSLTGFLSRPVDFFWEAHRVLRRGGYGIITFTNRESCLLKMNSLIRKMTFKSADSAGYISSCRLYDIASVTKNLPGTGFKVVEVRYYNYFLNCGRWLFPPEACAMYFEKWKKSRIMRRLGRNFMILAQKT